MIVTKFRFCTSIHIYKYVIKVHRFIFHVKEVAQSKQKTNFLHFSQYSTVKVVTWYM
jgi:hypothetical protein